MGKSAIPSPKLNLDNDRNYNSEDNMSSGILKSLIYSVSSFKLNSIMIYLLGR